MALQTTGQTQVTPETCAEILVQLYPLELGQCNEAERVG